jgi:Uncharacterized conserved protein (COG2071)
MQSQARRADETGLEGHHLPPAGRQWLDVSARVVERYLITFRAPARKLVGLVPAPLSLDVFRGHGFVSVCALELEGMGIAGTPSWLRFGNLELLYRVGVRYRGEASFLTLRSDVSARALAWLGARFSHYRPHLGRFALERGDGLRMECRTPDGAGDSVVHLDPGEGRMDGSVFDDAGTAARFLLGMRISVDRRPDGRVQVQEIDHEPWGARAARVREQRFAFLEQLERTVGTRLVLDHALGMRDLQQTWRAVR